MKIVCPRCTIEVALNAGQESTACPSCGQPLEQSEPRDPCADDDVLDQLTDDLRDAFGLGAFPLQLDLTHAAVAETVEQSCGRSLGWEVGATDRRLGDFVLIEELGRGGMGIVYRARQESLDREVALKVLPTMALRRPASVVRFRRESRAAARLHHTNIVPVYARGEHDGSYYYAMELIEGESLASVLRNASTVVGLTPRHGGSGSGADTAPSEPRSGGGWEDRDDRDITQVHRSRHDYRRIAGLMAEVADGLEHAHRCGVIHRDVKPQNLLLGVDDHLHITDFGLAYLQDEPHLTASGDLMGTPAYMSPEQIEGQPRLISERTDIYSLGVTLYELLTLKPPFEGKTRDQIITRICNSEPQSPRRFDRRIPADLETICLRAIEKEPDRRYVSAATMAEDLRRFADERPILTRRTSRLSKGLKWARRHKAATTAIVAVTLLVTVGAISLAGLAASRHARADRLLDQAYRHLVYLDYRQPAQAISTLDRAEDLGGDPDRITLLRAIPAIREANREQAIADLTGLHERHPNDVEVLYLLAWAHRRNDQPDKSRARFDQAEELGGPVTAAQWFFRGLAMHYRDPAGAIDSYKQARQILATEGEFYPQATLHLARAHNQLIYKEREIEAFEEASDALQDLVDHQIYGAYPYYLLSISHRYAAEVYQEYGPGAVDRMNNHYALALDWARQGQERAEPGNDAPLTAEAECLESMGLFEEAAAVRTSAIQTAAAEVDRWEGYHYRWRLYYWIGSLDEALADLRTLQELDPSEPDYATFFPALVHAEDGRLDDALAAANSCPVEPSENGDHLLASAVTLRLLGRPDEADRTFDAGLAETELSEEAEQRLANLYALACGAEAPESFIGPDEDQADTRNLRAAEFFHAAIGKLSKGDRSGAMRDFERSHREFDSERGYTYVGKTLLLKLRQDPTWPPWIPSHRGVQDGG